MKNTEPHENQTPLLTPTKYKSFRQLILMIFNICLSSFYFGYSMAYLGTFKFDVIASIFGISDDNNFAEGVLQGLVPIGAGLGSISSALLLQHFSRRNSMLFVNCLAFIAGLLILIPNQYLLFTLRFVQGICVGFYSVLSPLLIKQFSPTEVSGSLGALNQFSIAFGVFFAYLLQLILIQFNSQEDHWRIMFGFTLITLIFQTKQFLTVYKFETPKYLLENGKQQQCRQVLKSIYREEFVNGVLEQAKNNLATFRRQNQSNLAHPQEKNNNNRKLRLFVAIHLAMLQQFVGINSVVAYGTIIAQRIFPHQANLIPVFLTFQQVAAALATSYLISKFGRKQILQKGTICVSATLLLISAGFYIQTFSLDFGNFLIILNLVLYMASFGLSLGPIVWLYIPQILEAELISISTLVNWASAAFIIIMFPILEKKFGSPGPLFIFYSIWGTISYFVTEHLMIETKDKTQTQIYEQYEKLSKSPFFFKKQKKDADIELANFNSLSPQKDTFETD